MKKPKLYTKKELELIFDKKGVWPLDTKARKVHKFGTHDFVITWYNFLEGLKEIRRIKK